MKTNFRRLQSEDIPLLTEFFKINNDKHTAHTFNPFPLTPASAQHILKNWTDEYYLGLFEYERMVVFTMLRGYAEGYEIPSFAILVGREYRGKGYGRKATKLTIEKAKELHASKVRLSVYDDNRAGINLYQRLGFEVTEQLTQEGRVKLIMHKVIEKSFD